MCSPTPYISFWISQWVAIKGGAWRVLQNLQKGLQNPFAIRNISVMLKTWWYAALGSTQVATPIRIPKHLPGVGDVGPMGPFCHRQNKNKPTGDMFLQSIRCLSLQYETILSHNSKTRHSKVKRYLRSISIALGDCQANDSGLPN